jgi:hypothetical protein
MRHINPCNSWAQKTLHRPHCSAWSRQPVSGALTVQHEKAPLPIMPALGLRLLAQVALLDHSHLPAAAAAASTLRPPHNHDATTEMLVCSLRRSLLLHMLNSKIKCKQSSPSCPKKLHAAAMPSRSPPAVRHCSACSVSVAQYPPPVQQQQTSAAQARQAWQQLPHPQTHPAHPSCPCCTPHHLLTQQQLPLDSAG